MWFEHRFVSFDETPIFYRHCRTKEPARAAVIIVHGMGEHGGRYTRLAGYLAGLGVESVIPDLRGFGQSGGRRACVKQFSDFHRDLDNLVLFISRTHRGTPLFLLGHSFGGLIASSYLAFCNPPKIGGLVLSSPIFGIALPIPLWRRMVAAAFSYLFPDFSQPSGVKPALLTHDVALIREYENDALIYHRVSARLYCELLAMIRRRASIAQRISSPVLLLQAGEDFVVSKEEALGFYDLLRADDKELEVYGGWYHELLNEVDREKVFSRIGLWILRHLNHN